MKRTSKEELELRRAIKSIKIGHLDDFEVINVGEKSVECICLSNKAMSARVDYEKMSDFVIIPSEYFEVGDVFRGEVLFKDRGMVLAIKPTLNLKEVKQKQKQQLILESWMNNGTVKREID